MLMSRGRNYMNTTADIRTRVRYIEEVGTLLDQMINEDIVSLKDIENEFPITYDTIRKLRKIDHTTSFETIRKIGYIIGHYLHVKHVEFNNCKGKLRISEDKLILLNRLQNKFEEIYGLQAIIVKEMIDKKIDIREFLKEK